MKTPETVLLEIIDTGPCEHGDLIHQAPNLIYDEIGAEIKPGEIQRLIDKLNSLGHIGCTGSKLDTIVVSQLGQKILSSV